MKNLPVRMPEEMHQKIKAESIRRDMSMNAIVMESLSAKYDGPSKVERKIDKIIKLLNGLDRNNG